MPAATSEPSTAAGSSALYLPVAVTLPRTAAASRVWPESTVMVSREIRPLDPREALRLRRRDQQNLAPLEGRGPSLCEQDRIAFALDVARIPVHLVEEQVARGH